MLEIDRPFAELDEVWIWPIPHPLDPEEPKKLHRVTRIGTRTGGALVGRVELRTRPSRTILGAVDELNGLGEWRTAKLGSLRINRSDQTHAPRRAVVRSSGVDGFWRPGGLFQVGDDADHSFIATGGRPFARGVRDLGDEAVTLGRSLLRRIRRRGAPDEGADHPELPAEVEGSGAPAELSAFGRWLVATPEEIDGVVAWRVTIDRHEGAPESVGLGLVLAAVALLHVER